MNITLRHTTTEDEPFLFELFCDVHTHEFASLGLVGSYLETLLSIQFDAQRQHYNSAFADADDNILVLDGKPIGRLIVARRDKEFRLVEIALLTEFRNRGIGTVLIQHLIEEATQTKKPVTLHVEKKNVAYRLYERLGFTKAGETDTHYFMECIPAS